MSSYRYILGSASPRRKEILGMLVPEFDIIVSTKPEVIPTNKSPKEVVCSLANQKAQDVAGKVLENEEYQTWLKSQPDNTFVVIGADTVVVIDDMILGKPKDKEDAKRMLRLLSGNTHHVYTGVSVHFVSAKKTECVILDAVDTGIVFQTMTEEELNWYVATGECSDKAGAYAVQGYAARFITQLNGDYFNVVGLPLSFLYQALKEKGIRFE